MGTISGRISRTTNRERLLRNPEASRQDRILPEILAEIVSKTISKTITVSRIRRFVPPETDTISDTILGTISGRISRTILGSVSALERIQGRILLWKGFGGGFCGRSIRIRILCCVLCFG